MINFATTKMMNIYKGKAKIQLSSTVMLLLFAMTLMSMGNIFPQKYFYKKITLVSNVLAFANNKKTIAPPKNISIVNSSNYNQFILTDTIKKKRQKVDTIGTIKGSKDSLDAPIVYHADDSMVMDVPGKKIYLYGKESKTTYKDNDLSAPGIVFDQEAGLVTASLKKDSLGKVIAYPTFIQKDFKSISDTIVFNMKTGKGLTKGTYTQQGEMYVYGEKIKKVSENVFYAQNGRFTTCNLDTPHFAFVSKKIKFINQKMAITGPVHPEIEGIPLPIYFPFGIYPLSQGRHSGLIAPTFTVNEQYGIALQGIGYYKVLNDNWDVTTQGTIYSYGGFMASIKPRYYKRYHYQGNFGIDYNRLKLNFKGDPDYSVNKTFKITWDHSIDTKSRPGVSFRAHVDAGSTKYNQSVVNNPNVNVSNRLYSSIQYAKIWKDKPYNISINASHDQNAVTKTINVTLPDVTFNLNTLYPFRKKEVVGNYKWYENIGIALNSSAKSVTYFTDANAINNSPIGKQIVDNLQWGASHNVPISLQLPQLGALQISPSISYSEKWYQKQFIRTWDATNKKLDTSVNKGFYTARDMSFSLSFSSRIFGMIGFNKASKVQAIRHEISPSLSISYKPNMNASSYYLAQVDTLGNRYSFSKYDGSLYGAYGQGRFGGINFGIGNNIQMKVKNKKDTADGGTKKIAILDGLNIGGSYNFLSDSFKLSMLSINANTNLFNKININAGTTIDPYQVNAKGRDINKYVWQQNWSSLGRITNGHISLSSSFKGGKKDGANSTNKSSKIQNGQPLNPNTGMPLDEYQTEAAYIARNPAEFTDFSIPWSINLGYSFNFTRSIKPNYNGYATNVTQDVNWNGTLGLTEKWQLALTGFYNIKQSQMGPMTVSIAREMHCWQMAINLSPIGQYRYFNITISPKSGILRDLKINRSRSFYDN